jgi:hypothetical protein
MGECISGSLLVVQNSLCKIMKQCDFREIWDFPSASQVVGATSKALHNKDNLPVDNYIKDVLEHLKEFEAELANRGTTFFGGKF